MKEKIDEIVLHVLESIGRYFSSQFGNFFTELITTLMEVSSDLCLIAGLVAAIMFIFGWKKGKDIPLLAWGIHLIIQIIGRVILGV